MFPPMRKYYPAHVLTAALVMAATVLIPMGVFSVPADDFKLIAWNEGQKLLNFGAVDPGYPYPLWTLVLMLPFASVSPEFGAQLWFACSLLLLGMAIVSLMDLLSWPMRFPILIIVSLFAGAFGPVFTTLWLGQLNAVSLLSLVLLAQALKSSSWLQAGFVLAIGLIKPQLTFLLSGLVLAVAVRQHHWRILIGFGAVLGFFVAISVPFTTSVRQIFGGGVDAHLATYLAHTSTLWGLCLTLVPDAIWIPAVVSALLIVWLVRLWSRSVGLRQWTHEITFLISVTTTVNLLVVPYSWFYNQAVLILPLCYAVDRIRGLPPVWRVVWLVLLIAAVYFLPTLVDLALTRIYRSEAYQVIPVIAVLMILIILQWQTERQFQAE
jgi:hypothetical protein